MVGNGGDAGGVNYPDMWAPVTRFVLLSFRISRLDTNARLGIQSMD